MRLGLIGTGKQGQRYLMEKNGGADIVATYDRGRDSLLDWVTENQIQAVVIASHPASHVELGMQLLRYRVPLLIEKPLALNLADCERLLDYAAEREVPVEVAHTHLWSNEWRALTLGRVRQAKARLVYTDSGHDYSPWLDWAPHALALLEECNASRTDLDFSRGEKAHLSVRFFCGGQQLYVANSDAPGPTPMWNMMESFKLLASGDAPYGRDWRQRNNFNRRVYRALFAE